MGHKLQQVDREIVGQHKDNVGTSDRRRVRGRNYPERARWIAGGGRLLFNRDMMRLLIRPLARKDKKNWGQRNEQAQPFSSRYSCLWMRSQRRQIPLRRTVRICFAAERKSARAGFYGCAYKDAPVSAKVTDRDGCQGLIFGDGFCRGMYNGVCADSASCSVDAWLPQ
jgi:hypothetical protein